MAAVCTGPWFLLDDDADLELADEALEDAELRADEPLDDEPLVTLASFEDSEEASDPVAVASSELMDEAWLLPWEVMEDSRDARPLPTPEVTPATPEDIMEDMMFARSIGTGSSGEAVAVGSGDWA